MVYKKFLFLLNKGSMIINIPVCFDLTYPYGYKFVLQCFSSLLPSLIFQKTCAMDWFTIYLASTAIFSFVCMCFVYLFISIVNHSAINQ